MQIDNKLKVFLFTDASVNPQSKIGFGAYLLLDENQLLCPLCIHDVKTRKFENTTSSKLELETLLWALNEINVPNDKIIIYTDCQNIISLKDRRARLEKNSYLSSSNKLIKNHKLYKEFYTITDMLDCKFVKVKGHKKKGEKDYIDNIFTLVDKASRTALRVAHF
jgi:ribonuclease HI